MKNQNIEIIKDSDDNIVIVVENNKEKIAFDSEFLGK